LMTPRDPLVHLGAFIVLQLLRQGRLSVEAVQVLKQNFELLNVDQTGTLTLEQATSEFWGRDY
jgi:hypothetical protein